MKCKQNIGLVTWNVSVAVFVLLGLLIGTVLPTVLRAETIINNVSVEANSREGGGLSSLQVQTWVDGTMVENYHISSSTESVFYSNEIKEKDSKQIITASSLFNQEKVSDQSRLTTLITLLRQLVVLLAKASVAS